jgi:hypothetical protein
LYRVVHFTEKQISEDWKEFTESEEGKKHRKRKLGGLHDDGMLMSDEILGKGDDMDYQRTHSKTYSKEEIDAIKARVLKDIEKNPKKYAKYGVEIKEDGDFTYTDETIAKIIASELWGGRKPLKGELTGKYLEDGSYNLTLREKVEGQDGTKVLGAHTGERSTATGVPPEFLKFL